ncbi:nucleoside deaminase [Hydrogenivirga sp. 128-5-R1-1]|uniref:nucleoside deaminase n=1 Tax=Hydrogenivirga sp. 128-5-R1-1 TaxID=392423 RepID=UPI00015F27C2|nr:nucleoside deaminase [Hydrogenivirga sp. 128-5-R1-1]EDP73921.1 Cytosine/adenosine deaminase [Hydrogenivirga sp. 128-5-R1-1]
MQKNIVKKLIEEAKKAYKKDEVPVGALIVRNGEIISKGHNQRITKNNALYHAEIVAIEKACKKLKSWRLDDCEIWVSLEPCVMCAGAIMQSRIKKVYFLAQDEKGGAVISKYRLFDDNKLPFKVDYEYIPVKEASDILKRFFKEKR